MCKYFVFLLLVFLTCFSSKAQQGEVTDSLVYKKFVTLVNINRSQSYITFTDGIGNLQPLIFEANLAPSYFFSSKGVRWALILNPQVQIRMLNKVSLPIQTPSYRVGLEYYRGINFWDRILFDRFFYENALWFLSVNHHSNGQDGSFYLDGTETINLQSGNFSTNYLTAGLATYSLRQIGDNYFSIRELKFHYEYHPYKWYVEELKEIYGFYRLYASFGLLGPRHEFKETKLNEWLRKSSFSLQTGWIFGSLNEAPRSDASKRLIIDFKYQYQTNWFDELAFFIRFYRGQDYYNIYFSRTLTNFTVGLSSDIVKLRDASRYLKN